MRRWLWRGALALVALAVVGAATFMLAGRPRLDDHRDRADQRWTRLRGPLAQRYAHLDGALDAMRAAGAGTRDLARDLARELDRWDRLRRPGGEEPDSASEATSANALEGLARRARATVGVSPRLGAVPELTGALDAFGATVPPPPAVRAYNDAARTYQETRQALRTSFVARAFGYEARPTLVLETR